MFFARIAGLSIAVFLASLLPVGAQESSQTGPEPSREVIAKLLEQLKAQDARLKELEGQVAALKAAQPAAAPVPAVQPETQPATVQEPRLSRKCMNTPCNCPASVPY